MKYSATINTTNTPHPTIGFAIANSNNKNPIIPAIVPFFTKSNLYLPSKLFPMLFGDTVLGVVDV